MSYYFHSFFPGEKNKEAQPLRIELHSMYAPPAIPAASVQIIKGPSVTYYRNGKKAYFVSDDGSHVCLDPGTFRAAGHINRESPPDAAESLIGPCIIEALKYQGLYLLHAAALKGDGISCLVSGDGGCGKTTATLSFIREGLRYVSDDSIFLKETGDGISVSPLYKNVHLDQCLADRFPDIAGGDCLNVPQGTKMPVDLSETLPFAFIPSLKPDAIIFPKIISGEESALRPLGRTETYTRLLKQTVLAVDNDISKRQLRSLEKLVKQTCGFELSSGRDIFEDTGKLIKLMGEISCQNAGI
ncbi:MAG: hypothetical protein C4560_06715 [Nitrospiraceae bacterium]|nr:MAG: hypothetical protein C4560_06715 [Nitrospiraceae bacterium]